MQIVMLVAVAVLHVERAERGEDAQPSTDTHVRVRDSSELLRAVQAAGPGTTILLEPGTYQGGLTLNNVRGEAGRAIVIRAADPKDPPVIAGGQTGLHLSDPAHVELRDLVLRGSRANGLNIDDGGSYDSPAQHVVLQGLTIRDVGSDGNHDGNG